MRTDLDISDYYKEFIKNVEEEKLERLEKIKDREEKLKNLKDFLLSKEDYIKIKFRLLLRRYTEFLDMKYKNGLFQYDVDNALLSTGEIHCSKELKDFYLLLLRLKQDYYKLYLIHKKESMSFAEYRAAIKKYYMQVQKEILDGCIYKYSSGIGEIYINRAKNPKGRDYKGRIDYEKSKAAKKKLIEEGKIPFSKRDYEHARRKGEEYLGQPYIVYLNEEYLYEFALSHGRLATRNIMKFTRTDYRGVRFRGKSNEDIFSELSESKEVYDLDVDMGVKLRLLLMFNEAHALKYIRNEEQTVYKYRKDFSKDRK